MAKLLSATRTIRYIDYMYPSTSSGNVLIIDLLMNYNPIIELVVVGFILKDSDHLYCVYGKYSKLRHFKCTP